MLGRFLLTWTALLGLLLPTGMLGAVCKVTCTAPTPGLQTRQVNQVPAMHHHHPQADTKTSIGKSHCCPGGSSFGSARCLSSCELAPSTRIISRTPDTATTADTEVATRWLPISEVLTLDSSPPSAPILTPSIRTSLRI